MTVNSCKMISDHNINYSYLLYNKFYSQYFKFSRFINSLIKKNEEGSNNIIIKNFD